jgi:hypothetical protein
LKQFLVKQTVLDLAWVLHQDAIQNQFVLEKQIGALFSLSIDFAERE